MKKKYFLDELQSIDFSLNKPYLVFLRWDLWSGKTTFSQHIFSNILWITDQITSPTYTYYNKYWEKPLKNRYICIYFLVVLHRIILQYFG